MQIKDMTRESDGEVQELVVTITADADEVNEHITSYFKQLAKNDIPGFRKGKAPRSVIEKNAGGHDVVYAAIAEEIVNDLAPAALDDADVIFISEPQLNIDDLPQEKQPFSFTVSAKVPPEGELSSYDPVSIKMPPNEATEAEIDIQVDEIRSVYYNYEEILDSDYEAAMGDFVTVRMTVTNDGAQIGGLTDVERMIGLGEGTMPESFDEHIVGCKIGYQLDFDFEAIGEEERPELGDGKLHAYVEIKAIRKRSLPELNEEFFAKIGAKDEEDLRKQLKYTIGAQKDRELPVLMEQRVVDALVKRLVGEVPEYYIDFLRDDVGRELMQKLQKEGTDLQNWLINNNIETEKIQQEVTDEAIARAERDMALEALFKNKGWEVTQEDIDKQLANDDDAEASLKALQDAHRVADLRKMCRQSKAARWLIETAEVEVVE